MQTPNYSKQRADEIYNQWHYETNVKPRTLGAYANARGCLRCPKLPKDKRKTRSKKEIRNSISFKTIVNRNKNELIIEF